jgi:hypothetical protein
MNFRSLNNFLGILKWIWNSGKRKWMDSSGPTPAHVTTHSARAVARRLPAAWWPKCDTVCAVSTTGVGPSHQARFWGGDLTEATAWWQGGRGQEAWRRSAMGRGTRCSSWPGEHRGCEAFLSDKVVQAGTCPSSVSMRGRWIGAWRQCFVDDESDSGRRLLL